jgi:hypothetical protein
MAGTKSDRDSKEEIAQGMSEAGKGEKGKVHGEAGKGQHGHGADPSKLEQGMSEAGSEGQASWRPLSTAVSWPWRPQAPAGTRK